MAFVAEHLNEKKRNNYFAIAYFDSIVKGANFTKPKPFFVRMANNGEMGTNTINVPEKTKMGEWKIMFLPNLLPDQRDIIIACGQSGLGKTTLCNLYVKLYKQLNPDNKVMYLTTNDFNADKNLTHELYKNIPMLEFLQNLEEIGAESYASSDVFKDMLICVDDIGGLKDKKLEKLMYDFMDIISENMRKKNTSLFLLTHVPTAGSKTRTLIREVNKYIVFPNAQQVSSDRMLKTYLGLRAGQINDIINLPDRWACNDTNRKCIITESRIYKLTF